MSMTPVLRIEADIEMKLCRKCGEYWPADEEFFTLSSKTGKVQSPCKACIDESRQRFFEDKPLCTFPGCTNERYHWRYGRCKEHRGKVAKK